MIHSQWRLVLILLYHKSKSVRHLSSMMALKGGILVSEEGIHVWCLVATILAIAIALFLAIHPSNSPSSSSISMASVVGHLLVP